MEFGGWVVATVTIVLWCIREFIHARMVNSLLDRLMAKDLGQFKFMEGTLPPRRGKRLHAPSDEQMADSEAAAAKE